MDAAQYLSLQKNPASLSEESLKGLEEVLKQTPWFTGAEILYALNLFRENHPQYPAQLKKAAIYASDRRILKHLMDQVRQSEVRVAEEITAPSPSPEPVKEEIPEIQPEPVISEVTEPTDSVADEITVSPIAEITSEEQTAVTIPEVPEPIPAPVAEEIPASKSELREQLLAIVHKRLAEIEQEKKGKPVAPAISTTEVPEKEPPLTKTILSKQELIEKFIAEEPRISPPKTTFFNPSESAIRSNIDEEEIVTETLARLYARQGNITKAIKIYEKLSSLFPEKSRYFASQIEKINL